MVGYLRNHEFGRVWKAVVVAYLILSRCFLGEVQENYEKLQSR
jgi:hypothetical protein